jgi:hypothetical protein
MVTQETGSGLLDNNSLTSCVLVLLIAIVVVLLVGLVGCLYPS